MPKHIVRLCLISVACLLCGSIHSSEALPTYTYTRMASIKHRVQDVYTEMSARSTLSCFMRTQRSLALVKLMERGCGVQIDLMSFFMPTQMCLRLVLFVCSMFINKLVQADDKSSFVVAQGVLAVSVLGTGRHLGSVFNAERFFERLIAYVITLVLSNVPEQRIESAREDACL